jgi:hypothetical protein
MATQFKTVRSLDAARVAVDHLIEGLQERRLSRAERDAARAQVADLLAALGQRDGVSAQALRESLGRLDAALSATAERKGGKTVEPLVRKRLTKTLAQIGGLVAAGVVLSAPLAAAAQTAEFAPIVADLPLGVAVGDTVINPVTGVGLTVLEVFPNGVLATGNIFILTSTAAGSVFPDPANPAVNVTVASNVLNPGTGLPVTVVFTDGRLYNVVQSLTTAPGGGPGGVVTTPPFPPASGDSNYIYVYRTADGGSGGSDGALFVPASSGGAGDTGETISLTVAASHGNITTVSANLPGILYVSQGGEGGDGGDGYLGASGARGGRGGAGGTVDITSRVGSIATSGAASHGIVVQSRAGQGGEGGSGFVFSAGGEGGEGSSGGFARIISYTDITTTGRGAHGIFAQSLGSGAGSGGGSYGLFGAGGAGNAGGSGGTAIADNYGDILTFGGGSHGVAAQSIGGLGGDAGNSVGLLTFSDSGAPGGNGGAATAITRAGSSIQTVGGLSYGVFAQSVGGGGGNAGTEVSLVALGASGGTGGNGGTASATAESGSSIQTGGLFSHGVFAQSIGGGGGNGGITGGLLAVGSQGASGGLGGNVSVTSGANIAVTGLAASGIFAQSIGGGGGNATGSGGLVALGGSGGGAGGAGSVNVTTLAGGQIQTGGILGHGIFAQSVGGGGGTGSTSGGLGALGGTGGSGGNGGAVTVSNGGLILTSGAAARGVFAQSIGGGGGSGGDGGGLIVVGGSGGTASSGGAVTVGNSGSIQTSGNQGIGIQAQSVGGGGGDGGTTGGVFLTIGGSGGGGGPGGAVTVNHAGQILTGGNDAHGIFAQSVGGGGGNGGATGSVSAFAGVAIGGSGGIGSAGGNATLNLTQQSVSIPGGGTSLIDPFIQTSGDRARGVYLQSVGGGGGNGGLAGQLSVGYAVGVSIAVGGQGGAGGDGGTVNGTGDLSVLTTGDFSDGYFAQSIGGGGGNGGFALSFAFSGGETVSGALAVGIGGEGGAGGDGGLVTVDSGGAIQTDGDFSSGFIAQSVGGGGGNGGFSIALSGAGAGGASGAVSVGVGGFGGDGGVGNTVNALFDGMILTRGDDSLGALIQSVGGGGGNGGFNVTGAVSGSGGASGSVAVGVGGTGGGGGDGGSVTGRVGGDVRTEGDRSTAVVVQSMGGGGGNGGFAVAGSIAGAGTAAGAVSVGVGGFGADAGDGGSVDGSAGGDITTLGDLSTGLLVQSVGGGGGNGAFSVSGSIAGSGTAAGGAGVGVGGFAGGGGNGGVVRGEAEGDVYTEGDGSSGVVIQSLGGGGGNGGFAVGGSIAGSGTGAGAIGIGVGGTGGDGGDGGAVTAFARDIRTRGDRAGGFLAQSVGGGGGSGGFSVGGSIGGAGTGAGAVSIGVGGSGGGGGDAGIVTASVTGDVLTEGTASSAIVAQSLGGGGGSGGFTVAGSISGAGTAAGAVSVGVGGSGGDGGHGGATTLTVDGDVLTLGDLSDGVLAQSVGGGGGTGGFAVAGSISGAQTAAGTVSVSVGGTGGGGGDAGAVALTQTGDVTTLGNSARGVLAQSVGGGGGNGGFTVAGGISGAQTASGNIGVGVGGGGGDGGHGGSASGTVTGDLVTLGDDSAALLVQSVGGGGGNGGFNVTGGISGAQTGSGNILVGVGGFGGGGGDAGAVSGGLTGDVFTDGDRSGGVTYQSIGGGGGNGGFNVTGGITATVGSGGGAGTLGIGVGGFGGDGGNASTVNASVNGTIRTVGDQSHGALFQSVGGGGGSGGFNVTGVVSAGMGINGSLGFGLGGFGGLGGNAGDVTGVLTGDVITVGDGAFGTMLQSLGGSGGSGGFNVTGSIALSVGNNAAVGVGLGVGGFGGGGGDAGSATGTITGEYVTTGVDSDAVVVQSLGGGGGNGGFNVTGSLSFSTGTSGTLGIGVGGFGGGGGNSGDATLTRVGDTFASGANSDGIRVQSLAGGGGSGGLNVTGNISASTSGQVGGVGIGLGGFGGGGGDAGDVFADITGNVFATGAGPNVTTDAETVTVTLPGGETATYEIPGYREQLNGSNGVIAQSIGGGGGNGGINISGNIALTSPGGQAARAATIGIGGFGGLGGNAGNVTVGIGAPGTDRVVVQGTGDDASAVIAQSIGGGGGAGGLNVSGTVALDGVLTVGIGGFGGGGGTAGDVTVDVDADLLASGARSRGLSAQSIGGGGGSGGINISGSVTADLDTSEPTITFGLGGFGGAGNISGDVDVDHNGTILVDGVDSIGILAQSVAGGGGSGGLNVSAGLNLGGSTSRAQGYNLAVGVGGSGGDGADAGDVSLDSTGAVIVGGRFVTPSGGGTPTLQAAEFTGGGAGILVQSIGGGGGVGGLNATGAISPFGNPVAVGVGGSGGSGGHAGLVDVVRGYAAGGAASPSLLRTFGDNSEGLIAQSIGGGGGNAGMNFVVIATVSGQTDNPQSALVSVGGGGAGAGSGAAVSVRHAGTIITDGTNSEGLIAQSLGGGGGNANFNIGLGVARDANSLNLAVGGDTGAGGSGDTVDVDHVGTIVTSGDLSTGILAQSIGGGGGNAGFDLATSLLSRNSVSVTIGRRGGSGGVGGDVTVSSNGAVSTAGVSSSAIQAQSIGGGGGNSNSISVGASGTSGTGNNASSYSGSVAVGLEGGTGAISGDVRVDAVGALLTEGDDSRGVFAQSIGGGGGNGGATTNISYNATGSANVGVGGTGGTGAVAGSVTVDSEALISTEGDRSEGILAQSIGGGGGVGGNARSFTITQGLFGATPASSTTVNVNVGGTGGTGALAGLVDVANRGTILTDGEASHGIRAQSIGGGGGIGGATFNVRGHVLTGGDSIDVNVGGAGGTGGAGGAVSVLNEGLIWTQGRGAVGIAANSIGGGGGDAGVLADLTVGVTGSSNNVHRFALNIGGDGGTGGTGGDVSVINRPVTGVTDSGRIVTEGDDAYGIFAQSLGGGGGNGSSIISISGLVTGSNSATLGLNIGGAGGSGNHAGTVTVDNAGRIDTSGANAHGVLAQSIGGGGGNGGLVLAGSMAIGSSSATPLIAIGGTGGAGGDGGAVTVTNSGTIVTRGANAHGILAQSIGGGGGDANLGVGLTAEANTLVLGNALSALIGATGGGAGGAGGTVTVNHSGDITVVGEGSQAIRAESINGGGGTLTIDLDGIIGIPGVPFVGPTGTPTADPFVAARLGAESASGSAGGEVILNTTGTFGVAGANGVGAFNQSIGGGGGTLLLNLDTADRIDPSVTQPLRAIGFFADLGGTDGVDNAGGDVSSTHAGRIVTNGDNALGTLIQSIGGGGGRAIIDLTGSDTTLGDVNVTLGGRNGSNEQGGDIERQQTGAIATTGDLATGVLLQSIGGGGGSTSVILTGSAAPTSGAPAIAAGSEVQAAPAEVERAPVPGSVLNATLGANGGSGLDGGDVTAGFSGGVTTLGDSATGLVVQSIGGGGGEVRSLGVQTVNVTLGATGGADGDGGDLTITNNGAIRTEGARGHGVILQSIGGGGGLVLGDFTASSVLTRAANTGDGGDIRFTQTGDINALGQGAFGLIAQSVGGGGGFIDGLFAGTAGGIGRGGLIDLNVSGQIFAAGLDSTAVLAQSVGQAGGGDITLTSNGAIRGGSGAGAGVRFAGGAANRIITSGSISAVSGLAIDTGTGNDRVDNSGWVVGNVDLGSGVNVFNNTATGTFVAFNTIDLRDGAGSTGTFNNAGDFLMGLSAPRTPIDLANGAVFANVDLAGPATTNLLFGSRVINTVALDGNYVQTAAGHLAFDVAFGPYASDIVNVTGNATVAGTGEVILTWLQDGNRRTLFATDGIGVNNGLQIADTLALDYSIIADADGIHLDFVSDFGQPFLNANGRAVGAHMDSAIEVGGSGGIGRLMALLGNLRPGEEAVYEAIFDELNPEPHLTPLHVQFNAANQFGEQMFTCSDAVVETGQPCVWGGLEMTQLDLTGDAEFLPADADAVRFRGGYQRALDDRWSLAIAAGFDEINLSQVGDRAYFTGRGLHLGAGLERYLDNGIVLGFTLTGGWQEVDMVRSVTVFERGIGESEPETIYGQLGVSAEREWRVGGAGFIKPRLAAAVTSLSHQGAEEVGLEGLGFEVLEHDQTVATLTPEIEFGVMINEGQETEGRLAFTVGGRLHSEDAFDLPMRFVGANPAADPAVLRSGFESESLKAGVEFELTSGDRWTFRAGYVGEFDDRTETHTAGANLRIRF